MADVKTIDIDGIQWDIKDQVARDRITEINTTLKNQQTIIEQLNKSLYLSNAVVESNLSPNRYWVKINGLYSKAYHETTTFALSSRDGEYHELFCGNSDNFIPTNPFWLSYFRPTGKIDKIKFKNGSIWILLLEYSVLRVQQLTGTIVTISLSKENPPDDAVEILRKQITMS